MLRGATDNSSLNFAALRTLCELSPANSVRGTFSSKIRDVKMQHYMWRSERPSITAEILGHPRRPEARSFSLCLFFVHERLATRLCLSLFPPP
jgi:hypothetical protein